MAITFIQAAKSVEANASSGGSVAFGSNNTAGNVLVATCGNESNVITGISDTQGNIWTTFSGQVSGGHRSLAAYALNCKGGANTVSFSTSAFGFAQIAVAEYSGVNTLDSSNQASSSSSPGPSVTTTHPNAVIILLADDSNTTYGAGAGYAARTDNVGSTRVLIEDQIVSSTGVFAPPYTGGGAGQVSATTLAFYFVVPPSSGNQRTLVGAGT